MAGGGGGGGGGGSGCLPACPMSPASSRILQMVATDETTLFT
jgi:hypothetical protein